MMRASALRRVRVPASWRPLSPSTRHTGSVAATDATELLAASLVDSFPTARARHVGAAAAAAVTRKPWHEFTVAELLRHKAGRAQPVADRELSQRAGVIELRESDTVAHAAELMLAARVSSVLVNDGPVLAGIVTVADVIRRVLVPRRNPAETVLRDILSAQVTCATEAYTLEQCMATLETGKFRHIPVYRDLSGGAQASQNFDEDPRLVGVVSLTDVTFFMAKYLLDHDALGCTPVRALLPAREREPGLAPMAADPTLFIDDTATCADAMAKLAQSRRGIVVITRRGGSTNAGSAGSGAEAALEPPEPIGVLTERNMLRHAFSAGPYFRDALVRSIASDALPLVEPDLPLVQLAALQAARALNQVPIIHKGEDGKLTLRHVLSTTEVLHYVRMRVEDDDSGSRSDREGLAAVQNDEVSRQANTASTDGPIRVDAEPWLGPTS